MTEQEWLDCTDPMPLLEFVKGKASDRKMRLFACACCRRIWHLLTDPRSQKAIEVAEGYADGLVSEADRREALHGAIDATWARKSEISNNPTEAACLAIDPGMGV